MRRQMTWNDAADSPNFLRWGHTTVSLQQITNVMENKVQFQHHTEPSKTTE